ncbi:MAG: Prevent-host-death protein [Tardiphaga sp.]|jgi:antitoxin (DNA-binding transcriptional repressor) of toxin-antitoxin stability system|nr:Prevent-host-death protein [Tardiphaga sp.]
MKHVRLSDARAQIADLFDEVERGEMLLISREGEPMKQSKEQWPTITEEQRERARIAMEQIKEARKTAPSVSGEEILSWLNEGRKY